MREALANTHGEPLVEAIPTLSRMVVVLATLVQRTYLRCPRLQPLPSLGFCLCRTAQRWHPSAEILSISEIEERVPNEAVVSSADTRFGLGLFPWVLRLLEGAMKDYR